MTTLIAGLVLFLGIHSFRIYGEGLRAQLIDRLGPLVWKAVYSVISVLGLVLMASGYGELRQTPTLLWSSPSWISHPVSLLMLIASVLLVAAYIPKNSIKSKLGHPMVIGVKIWAFSHLLANGTLADLLLFGSLLLWAVLSFRAARQRDRKASVVRVPGTMLSTLATVVLGIGLWAWFVFHGHLWLIGVRPLVVG